MNRCGLIKRSGILIFLTILFAAGCSTSTHKESGYLEGVISIGPICPVERIPPDPACLPTAETYKAYPVSIFSSDGKKKISRLDPSSDGSYFCELPSGNYQVILEKVQVSVGGSNLPVKISINPLEKTLLNIDIDTGIR
jgi:hypothetical protein